MPWRTSIIVGGWVIAWVIGIDLMLGLGLAAVGDHLPGLQRYFEYGRSVEGKLERKLDGRDREVNILRAGWIGAQEAREQPDAPAPGADLLVAAYGQSFTQYAVRTAAAADSLLTLRTIGGPGAPPSHSFAAYLADAPLRRADVVVFGVLATSVSHMASMSGLIWMFENPAPYTFPRYRAENGRLRGEQPLIRSEADFRDTFGRDSARWREFKRQLARSDRGYDRFVFDATPADHSHLVRLLRRGWVAHRGGYDDGVYSPETGFARDADAVVTLKLLLRELVQQTRKRDERLIVLLLHTRGTSDHLYRVLGPDLEAAGIEFVSTHTLFSASDAQNFVADGHYTEEANGRLARALAARLRRHQPSSSAR